MDYEQLQQACQKAANEVAVEFNRAAPTVTPEIIVAGVKNYFRQRWHNYASNARKRVATKLMLEKAAEMGIDLQAEVDKALAEQNGAPTPTTHAAS
jgi:hypothetical protein